MKLTDYDLQELEDWAKCHDGEFPATSARILAACEKLKVTQDTSKAPSDHCSRCDRKGFELFKVSYYTGYGYDGDNTYERWICRDCRQQLSNVVAQALESTRPQPETGTRGEVKLGEVKAWADGFMLGLRQSGMDRWKAKAQVIETAQKWMTPYYEVLKEKSDDWFF